MKLLKFYFSIYFNSQNPIFSDFKKPFKKIKKELDEKKKIQ